MNSVEYYDILDLVPSAEDKLYSLNCDPGAQLFDRLLERNYNNEEHIKKYLKQRSRKQKKYHKNVLLQSALRQTNSSSQYDSAYPSLQVSTQSMTSMEETCPHKEINPENRQREDDVEEELLDIKISIKTKVNFLEPIREISPQRPEELYTPVKTEPSQSNKSKDKSLSIQNELRAALISKIRKLQQRTKQHERKTSLISFKAGETLYGQPLSIKKVDIRPEQLSKKVKTQESQPRFNQVGKMVRFKSRQSFDRCKLKSNAELFPQVTQGYQERNKRCLQIFLKMTKGKYKSYKNPLNHQTEESPSRKQRTNTFFRVSTLQLKNRL